MSDGSLATIEKQSGEIEDAKLPDLLDRNYLCKVTEEGLSVWRILCLKCRNSHNGFKRVSFSLLECDKCGAKPSVRY